MDDNVFISVEISKLNLFNKQLESTCTHNYTMKKIQEFVQGSVLRRVILCEIFIASRIHNG